MDDAEVMVIFSGSKVGDGECPQVPKGTVLAIKVKFTRPESLKKFQLKDKKFTVFDPSYPTDHGYKAYYYEDDGFLISTANDEVVQLVYIARQKDIHLCPKYYDNPKAFVAVGLIP